MEIVVTGPVEEAGLALLTDAGHDVRTVDVDGPSELAAAVEDADALVVAGDVRVTEAVFERAPDLQIVGRAGIDVDGIDVEAATDHGVLVANAPEESVRSIAEYVIGLVFATARGIPQGHEKLRDGYWAKGDILGSELDGKTAGLVGFDSVGQEVAKRLGNLGLDLVVAAPDVADDRITRIGAQPVSLEDCLDQADFLSLHAGGDGSDPIVGESELDALGEGYLVSCGDLARVDQAALAAAVSDGDLHGAALDVEAPEPLPEDSPLRGVEDVIVTPGIATSTVGTAESVATGIARQVLAAFEDDPVENAINAPSISPDEYPTVRPFADLAETAGRIALQLFDGAPETVSVDYAGDVATGNVEPITAGALTGVFDSLGWDANPVNARRVADREGVSVDVSTTHEAADFQNLLSVTVDDGTDALTVDGTRVGEDPRIVRIDDYRVEAIPHGYMLIVRNADEPGVIGYIGTVLGDHDVNIAGMFNSREAIGGDALTVYNLDEEPTDDVLAALNDDDRILETTVVQLNGL